MGMTTTYRMRTRIVRALIVTTTALSMGACAHHTSDHGSLLPTPSSVATVHTDAGVRPHYEEDSPQWNCQLDGDHKCGHVPACWTEHKSELPDERLCGLADHAAPVSDGWVFGDYMRDTTVR